MTDTAIKKRPRGRPKGTPKSGGRAKGVPNRDRTATVDRIMREADPIAFLCSVVRGGRFTAGPESNSKAKTWVWPSLDQRLSAAAVLARKVLPDQKAVESSGPDGAPFVFQFISGGQQ